MNNMKIIILDFETSSVLVYSYDNNVWEDSEEFIESEEIGLNSNNCQWMIVNELNIKIK